MALVKTDVSEELCDSIIRVTRISELGTTLAVTSNRRMLDFLHAVPWSRLLHVHGHYHLIIPQSVVPIFSITAD
jgi:hypothetical protein